MKMFGFYTHVRTEGFFAILPGVTGGMGEAVCVGVVTCTVVQIETLVKITHI